MSRRSTTTPKTGSVPQAAAAAACGLVLVLASCAVGLCAVFVAPEDVDRLAFPAAERVEHVHFFIDQEQKERIERLARAPVESSLIDVRVGWAGGRPIGYAIRDTHLVRTLPETLMVVLDAQGRVKRVHLLAFHEPAEYQPPRSWFEQLEGAADPARLRVGRGIVGITGATLSSRAVAAATRRALAIYRVLLGNAPSAPKPTTAPGKTSEPPRSNEAKGAK